jgi:NhaP-type Na+/H+ or K+/H+ antiporter
MVPVALSMLGSGLKRPSVAYLGWFGPRGLASIILVLLIIDESAIAERSTITRLVVATVGLSIFAHGITGRWGSNRYADWYEGHPMGDLMSEGQAVESVRVTRRLGGRS